MAIKDQKLCSVDISENGKYLVIHSCSRNNPRGVSVSRVRIRRISAFDSHAYEYGEQLYKVTITMQNGTVYDYHGAKQALYDQLCQYVLET
jgi:hypothetical protein